MKGMAREWRRAVFAALAVVMLGGACLLGVQAQAANDDAEEEQSPAGDGQSAKGGKKKQDPADAQRAIEAAQKQVQSGRAEQAVQAMTATLSAGNLPPALMAKALFVRGLAYRQQGRPAQAISDLNSALWLKGGLGSEDRTEASKELSEAYAAAGLAGRQAEAAPEPKAGGNFFSGLFGSLTPAASAPAPRPAPPPTPQAEAPPSPPARAEPPSAAKPSAAAVSSSWSSKTEVEKDRSAVAVAAPIPPTKPAAAAPVKSAAALPRKAGAPPAKAAPTPAPAGPAPAASKTLGRYLVQLGAPRTEAEARALAAKAKRDPALASRQSAIDRAVLGSMGAFYRVRFGPFASAQESQAACTKLQGRGFDCLPVTP